MPLKKRAPADKQHDIFDDQALADMNNVFKVPLDNKTQSFNMSPPSDQTSIVRVPPHFYLHVLDQTTNVTRVELGPQTYIRKENEKLILGPEKMIIVPPRHYCVIQNPVVKEEGGKVVLDKYGQVKLQHAEIEIRLEQDPFPLYPGEFLSGKVLALQVVPQNCAFRLRSVRDFQDDKVKRVAGDEWLFEGPGTYVPRKEVEVKETLKAVIIKPNEALRLRARIATKDRDGNARAAGEEWIVRRIGAYLPGAYEEVVKVVSAHILTKKVAIHIEATRTFKDFFGKERKAGEEWLVTLDDTEAYIPGVYEKVVGTVPLTTLTNRQFAVIVNPMGDDGKPQLGRIKLVRGEKSFFLQPGEQLEEDEVKDVYVLEESEGLILQAREGFKDADNDPPIKRKPGDKWMIRGPREYVPPVQVVVESKREAIPLDVNEGIYVRNMKTGTIRAIRGESYMLTQDEELWEKELPAQVEMLLSGMKDPLADRGQRFSESSKGGKRNKTEVVTFRVPHNTAVQVYDYKAKKARVVFGPDLVMLDPDEQFTQISLSGGKPKKPNQIRALGLLLGPDFCSDIITVETGDHARLSLQLCYNWHFDVGKQTDADAAKLFSVPDFVGDMCKAMASRIRGAVASVQFDDFHKNSARIIRSAVFGLDENNKVREKSVFPQNNLVVTSVDIQSVEPVDQRTRDSLMKSVQLAIEITTNSQEATAKHEAERVEQVARGRLERQRITDEAEAEKARKNLLELQAASSAVESCGQAKAEAQSRAEAARIEGEAAVSQADLKAQAQKIEAEAELERLRQAREAELQYVAQQNQMEIEKQDKLATIEVERFSKMVAAIGSDTIKEMATAGSDNQVKMLQSLGIQSALITDGRTPVNLLGTAQGLLGSIAAPSSSK